MDERWREVSGLGGEHIWSERHMVREKPPTKPEGKKCSKHLKVKYLES